MLMKVEVIQNQDSYESPVLEVDEVDDDQPQCASCSSCCVMCLLEVGLRTRVSHIILLKVDDGLEVV